MTVVHTNTPSLQTVWWWIHNIKLALLHNSYIPCEPVSQTVSAPVRGYVLPVSLALWEGAALGPPPELAFDRQTWRWREIFNVEVLQL